MAKRNRHLRISLAAKCQILFGAAVILIIGAALYVPWRRMDDLILEVNLQTAEGLAAQVKLQHVVAQRQNAAAGGAKQPVAGPASQSSQLAASELLIPRM